MPYWRVPVPYQPGIFHNGLRRCRAGASESEFARADAVSSCSGIILNCSGTVWMAPEPCQRRPVPCASVRNGKAGSSLQIPDALLEVSGYPGGVFVGGVGDGTAEADG